MKYCTHCGKPLEPDEKFCSKCGAKVPEEDRVHYTSSNNNRRREPNRSQRPAPQKQKPAWLFALIGFVIALLIAGIGYAAYNAYQNKNAEHHHNDQPASSEQNQSNTNKESELPETQPVSVDVNSDSFSENYMNSDNSNGYEGFYIGDSKDSIEKSHGKPEGTMDINGNEAHLYGNMAVSYDNNDQVDHVYVVPSDMTTDAFTDFHNTPNEKRGDTWYYDKNKDNSYTIKVYTDGSDVKAIENIEQI
ncbi:Predicted membrane protein [Staphylococcus piscifermentans]|uniref:zinc-ribbon domain-containing protein n=1 Tax=Staphylococcus piscifermentans TaxID=70258 RepID=UPI000B946ABF|nr:zinc ribbon domain-containing protein [Staphylococcus piscifermentans]RTX85158.1 zinc ribbon domain-containing protein [Staphylococcus piscifermentans]SNU96290.1 Predicted membrane protein [Staphylococcus piscifermentans]